MKLVDDLVKKLKHPFHSRSKKPEQAHPRTGEKGAALTMTANAKIEPHQEILDEAYAAGWDSAVSKSKKGKSGVDVSDSLASPPLEREESQEDKQLNITGLPKGETGNFTDEYGPTSQFAVGGSIGAHDLGVTANNRPAYEEDAAVMEGQGYFFKPKEVDVGQIPGKDQEIQEAFPKITTESPQRKVLKRPTSASEEETTSDANPERSLDPQAEHKANKSLFNKGGVYAAMEEIAHDPNIQLVHPDGSSAKSGVSLKAGVKDGDDTSSYRAKNKDESKETNASKQDHDEPKSFTAVSPKRTSSPKGTLVDYEEKEHEIDAEIAQTQEQIDQLNLKAISGAEPTRAAKH